MSQGGHYVLQIPASLWPTLQTNERFKGIKPTPNAEPNPDGSFTVKLNPRQYQIFQANMKKPAKIVPVDDTKKDQPSDSINVQTDSSMCPALLNFPLAHVQRL